jgi:hypothetical protein
VKGEWFVRVGGERRRVRSALPVACWCSVLGSEVMPCGCYSC